MKSCSNMKCLSLWHLTDIQLLEFNPLIGNKCDYRNKRGYCTFKMVLQRPDLLTETTKCQICQQKAASFYAQTMDSNTNLCWTLDNQAFYVCSLLFAFVVKPLKCHIPFKGFLNRMLRAQPLWGLCLHIAFLQGLNTGDRVNF